MNLNVLFDKLTNFKIKFTENPSPIEVSNKDLFFIVEETGRLYEFKSIELNRDVDTVEIILTGAGAGTKKEKK